MNDRNVKENRELNSYQLLVWETALVELSNEVCGLSIYIWLAYPPSSVIIAWPDLSAVPRRPINIIIHVSWPGEAAEEWRLPCSSHCHCSLLAYSKNLQTGVELFVSKYVELLGLVWRERQCNALVFIGTLELEGGWYLFLNQDSVPFRWWRLDEGDVWLKGGGDTVSEKPFKS